MNRQEPYQNLNFDRQPRTFPRRAIPVIITLIVFNLMWFFIPPNGLYWLLLISTTVLVWMASYGWRMGLAALIGFLNRLEQF